MNKSVRTVQRWEQDFGLPVRRPDKSTEPGTVLALCEELDLWMHQHTVFRAVQDLQEEVLAVAQDPQLAACLERLQKSNAHSREARQRSEALLVQTKDLLGAVRQEVQRLQTALEEIESAAGNAATPTPGRTRRRGSPGPRLAP